ncbi:hypothetical protein ACTQ49_08915 [Luteococcus sp. Sow4_B9]|uniref:hypothetical protein n=1 Tax=Luteococcus sp. Sow4_B9 TaxID=3438792 RepID=UPI003F982169
MSEPDSLTTAVALALTGERPAVTAVAASTPQEVVEALASAEWDAQRVQVLRLDRQAAELPWPFPVPRDVIAPVGFARYGAVLAEVRRLLGVDGLVPTRHEGPKVFGPAEQRLLAEVPPHHGFVG